MADLFDKLRKGLDKGIAAVGAKSKEVLETSQLRSQIRGLEEEKRNRLEELGNIVYTMVSRGTLDQERLQEKCCSIAAIDKAIQEKEEQIRVIQIKTQEAIGRVGLHPIAKCSCGADLFEGAKFCGRCGQNVQEILKHAQEAAAAPSAGCPRCGAPTRPGARFCGNCGSALALQGEGGPGEEGRR